MLKQAADSPVPAQPSMPIGQGASILKGLKGGFPGMGAAPGLKPGLPLKAPAGPAPEAPASTGGPQQPQSIDQQLISTFKQLMNKVKPSAPAAPAPQTAEVAPEPALAKMSSVDYVGFCKALLKYTA